MTIGPTAKGVNPIKMLAFERLITTGAKPLEIRAKLGMAPSTYRLYLTRYRQAEEQKTRRSVS